jgi:hypothetical protein
MRTIESESSWSIFLVVQLREFQSSVNESYKGLVVLAFCLTLCMFMHVDCHYSKLDAVPALHAV